MQKYDSRPFLTYSIIAILLMLGLGLVLAQLTKNFVADVIEERVKNEAQYLSEFVNDASDLQQLDESSRQLNIGMIYVTQEKEVLLNNTEDILRLSNKEMTTVQHFITDSDGNFSDYQKGYLREHMFFYPIQTNSSSLDGSLILVLKISSLVNVTSNIWLIIGITMFIGILVMATLGRNIFEKYIKPIRSASGVADELAKGNYRARTYEGNFGEAEKLTTSINVLARNLQEMTMQKQMQKDRLEAVISNMGNGLMLIDEKGYIHLVNRAFLESFGGSSSDYLGYLYYEAVKEEEIHKAVKEVFMTEETVRNSFILPLQIERRFLEVLGAPIINHEKEWKGVVLVFHDITELKHLEQMRKDFVANVSHELKTPITSIRGFSETLLQGAMEDEALREQFINIILKESERLQSLIHDLLELSKLEKEGFHLNIESVSLKELIEDIVPIVEQQAKEKDITINQNIHEGETIRADSARLKQVVMNMLTNAINYTPQQGEVGIELHSNDDYMEIIVKDTGIGIPEEDIPRIFERFYRVDKARSRNSGGTGLGLAIVKHIVEAHEGWIEVESEYQKGTAFHIYLPKKFTKT
ncbi:two-component system histidine kinase PnpS [Pontibacillus sp. HMF3514]|uniref:two-component system histidine kinase PnpS n=1 Tax=Pontibacillus sp. HMF3514 TaxID=2692425 RepID=UPI00131FBD1C|nr:ATP-binding protein [Pontibacillus sp. HMF3514]QHE53224.1 PAS domain-containing protein [Pontibacillus sp. HMF3514]